jgi:colanic acid/amylovoran biosynthesis glycosyltransferase
MRIAIVAGQFPALSETFIINHVVALLDLGHEVDVFALRSDQVARCHEVVCKGGLERLLHPLDPLGTASCARRK